MGDILYCPPLMNLFWVIYKYSNTQSLKHESLERAKSFIFPSLSYLDKSLKSKENPSRMEWDMPLDVNEVNPQTSI